MKETLINPIGNVRQPEHGISQKALIPVQADAATGQEPVIGEIDKSSKRSEIAPDPASNVSNVSIHFRLDDKTKELTLFVVDRKSKRVLRSIPASELHKLKAGELLKLTA
jgi:hypothetical protein